MDVTQSSEPPPGNILERLLLNKLVDPSYQPGFFRDRQKLDGLHHPSGWVLPTHQRFYTGDLAGRERHLGLVVNPELALAQTVSEFALCGKAGREFVVHLVREELVAILAAPLDVVHGDIGVLNERLTGITRLGIHGNADTRADKKFVAVDDERRIQPV